MIVVSCFTKFRLLVQKIPEGGWWTQGLYYKQETWDKTTNFQVRIREIHAGFVNVPSSHGNQQLPPFISWNQDIQTNKQKTANGK
jgi:hypothetical protein